MARGARTLFKIGRPNKGLQLREVLEHFRSTHDGLNPTRAQIKEYKVRGLRSDSDITIAFIELENIQDANGSLITERSQDGKGLQEEHTVAS